MQDYLRKVLESVSFINEKISEMPEIAIILGSGLGGLADEVMDRVEIPYSDIPNFPASKVVGHENKLIIGKIYNKNVIVMQGRFHYYEGYEMDEVTFPIKVFALLGVSKLIVSNAAGGLNKKLKSGDLMLITDHINTFGLSPLRGENISEFGERFPGMRNAYSPRLIELAKEQAKAKDLTTKLELKEGVYAFMPGPQYETEAEIKMLDIIGADAVGMSTVPEVISAVHSGIEVLGITCITDECYAPVSPSHERVLQVAEQVSEKFKTLVMKVIMAM
ncbi:MAG: purine-nucleoside phosphorylase [Clostridia bacterium]|nr:purine-nucleoside phosphorylase [Clostridia bacterium]